MLEALEFSPLPTLALTVGSHAVALARAATSLAALRPESPARWIAARTAKSETERETHEGPGSHGVACALARAESAETRENVATATHHDRAIRPARRPCSLDINGLIAARSPPLPARDDFQRADQGELGEPAAPLSVVRATSTHEDPGVHSTQASSASSVVHSSAGVSDVLAPSKIASDQ